MSSLCIKVVVYVEERSWVHSCKVGSGTDRRNIIVSVQPTFRTYKENGKIILIKLVAENAGPKYSVYNSPEATAVVRGSKRSIKSFSVEECEFTIKFLEFFCTRKYGYSENPCKSPRAKSSTQHVQQATEIKQWYSSPTQSQEANRQAFFEYIDRIFGGSPGEHYYPRCYDLSWNDHWSKMGR